MQGYLEKNNSIVKNQKGITLIELLAVIVILGIIAAIAVPAVGGMISKSRVNADKESYNIVRDAGLRYAMAENLPVGNNQQVTITDLVTKGYLNEEPVLQSDKVPGKKFSEVRIDVSTVGTYVVRVYDGASTPDLVNPTVFN